MPIFDLCFAMCVHKWDGKVNSLGPSAYLALVLRCMIEWLESRGFTSTDFNTLSRKISSFFVQQFIFFSSFATIRWMTTVMTIIRTKKNVSFELSRHSTPVVAILGITAFSFLLQIHLSPEVSLKQLKPHVDALLSKFHFKSDTENSINASYAIFPILSVSYECLFVFKSLNVHYNFREHFSTLNSLKLKRENSTRCFSTNVRESFEFSIQVKFSFLPRERTTTKKRRKSVVAFESKFYCLGKTEAMLFS